MISAIVLAAGSSTRMGNKNKLLLPYKSVTFVEQVVGQLLETSIDEIIVVVGYEREEVMKILSGDKIRFAVNDRYKTGMTSSIQVGTSAVSQESLGMLICLSDMPFLTKVDYQKMIDEVSEKKEILVPFYNKSKGNPVYFSSDFKEEILTHEELEGCRGIVGSNSEFVKKIDFKNNHILKDVDTGGAYALLGSK